MSTCSHSYDAILSASSGSYEELPSNVTMSPSFTVSSEGVTAIGLWFMVITTSSDHSISELSVIVSLKVSLTVPGTSPKSGAVKLASDVVAPAKSSVTSGEPSICSQRHDLISPCGSSDALPSNITRSPSFFNWSGPAFAEEGSFIVITTASVSKASFSSVTVRLNVNMRGVGAGSGGAVKLVEIDSSFPKVTRGVPSAACTHLYVKVVLSGSYDSLPSNMTSSSSNTLLSCPGSDIGLWFILIFTVSEWLISALSTMVSLNVRVGFSLFDVGISIMSGTVNSAFTSSCFSITMESIGMPGGIPTSSQRYDLISPCGSSDALPSNITNVSSFTVWSPPASAVECCFTVTSTSSE